MPADHDRLLDDPREAFVEPNQQYPYLFKADLELVVDHQGFGCGARSWHPFVHGLTKSGDNRDDLRNKLQSFYTGFRPANAKEAIAGFDHAPELFKELPPYMFCLTPWSVITPETALKIVKRAVEGDNAEHGHRITLEEGGHPGYGPVSPEKLELELDRLLKIRASLCQNGYNKAHGPCRFRVLRLGRDIRLVSEGGGHHRNAAAAALSLPYVPGDFFSGRLILNVDDIELWPNVKSGLWTRTQAVRYVEHLFHFDARSWAEKSRLLCTSENASPMADRDAQKTTIRKARVSSD